MADRVARISAAEASADPVLRDGYFSTRPGLIPTVALLATLCALSPRLADAAPDSCTADLLEGNRVICSGDQSAGIASGIDFNSTALPGPFNTLDLNANAITIQPAAGTDGVVFGRTAAGDVTVNSGIVGVGSQWILTTGANVT